MKKEKWNVLVFPAGTEHGIEIWKSLKDCKEIELFAATIKGINHSEYIYTNVHYLPSIYENDWFLKLQEIIEDCQIDIIYPANSFVIDKLIENRDILKCRLALPSNDLIEITRSKLITIEKLKNSIPTPEIYNVNSEFIQYPVFVKPVNGYGSQNSNIIESEEILNIYFKDKNINEYIIQELLPGREYSIDCLSDKNGLIYSSPRTRERIRMGTSMHSEIVQGEIKELLINYANVIFSKIPITGAWFFQVKEDRNGILKLLEVEIRIAGTMALNRVLGINFPLLSLYIFENLNVATLINNINIKIDRCLLNRYSHSIEFHKVYIDLDDTIIINKNKINTDLIKFLFQCVNNGIKIILISKNLEIDKTAYLKKWKIYDLFDKIIWLNENESKCDYIVKSGYENSIFIDDSFTTRQEVSLKLGIPTFDCSMIEMLIDDRI